MNDSRLWDPAETVVSSGKEATQRFDLSFPKDIGEHGMLLNFSKYSFGALGNITGQRVGSILLPIPANISETYSIENGPESLQLLGTLGAEALTGNINLENTLNSLGDTGDSALLSNPTAAANFFMQSGLAATATGAVGAAAGRFGGGVLGVLAGQGAAGSALGSALGVASGTALNPHTTVMFRGMNLRQHSFEWTFSPKSSSEGETLRRIIRAIKKNSLPSYQAAGGSTSGTALDRVLLRYPNVVDISFVGLDQAYFYAFKTCMITQVQVDYSSQGNAFFAGDTGSKPVMVKFTLSLIESKIHTADDFESGE